MQRTIQLLSIFLGIFISSTLISGAGVEFPDWYKAPESISRPLIVIICFVGVTRFFLFILNYIFKIKKT